VGEVAYKSTLLTSSRIHLVFYVSLLKRDIGNSTVELELVIYYVWKALVVLAHKEVLKGNETIIHVFDALEG
jgi:hypothetical protein